MNQNANLTKRQKQFIERLAWGASYKEVADFFRVSWSTVDNTLRNAKERLGLNKVTELGAWWFCTNYHIDFDLSPLVKQTVATGCLCLFLFGEVGHCYDFYRVTRRGNAPIEEFARMKKE